MAELAPKEAIAALRKPREIFTTSYLEDPIRFAPDPRFDPETAVRQSEDIVIVERDQASFAVVDMNAPTAQFFPVIMYSPLYNATKVKVVVDTQIQHLAE